MNKYLKIIGIAVGVVILSGCGSQSSVVPFDDYSIARSQETACNCPTCPPEKPIQEQFIEFFALYRNTVETRDWDFHYVEGNSMEEYGFHSGSYLIVKRTDCQVADFCIFQCLSEKCHNDRLIKKVMKRDGGKYWFQGNENRGTCPSGVISETNCDSFDSRDYGWLIKDIDFEFVGTTTLDDQRTI